MENLTENKASIIKRFWIYQNERFPIFAHGLMISAFTFSAVSYSRICQGKDGFIDWTDFLIGIFATVTLFFLVRVFDEFKDKEDDKKYRTYLPVPRGLISLNELKYIGLSVGIIQILVISIFQTQMLFLYMLVIGYLILMAVEFFVPTWLKQRQITYITSHMVIIPLIDLYASGLDWLLEDDGFHWGLAWFFAVSFMNGLVIEFGRKIRTPETEEEGVVSYTKMYGTNGGVIIWIILLLITMALAMGASYNAHYSSIAYLIYALCFLVFSVPAWLFLNKKTKKRSKLIEYASAGWTFTMYLSLGGIPMLKTLLS
jgi:4-hydroxybenzoate polyprenyltransferase